MSRSQILPIAGVVVGVLVASAAAAAEAPLRMPDGASLSLLAALAKASETESVVLSPASFFAAYGMARAGLRDAPLATAPAAPIPPRGNGPLRVASGLWLDEGVSLTEPAGQALEANWQVTPETLDLGAEGQARINAWVAEASEGGIEALIPDPLDAADLVLVNVIAFKDRWAEPFDSSATAPRAFQLGSGQSVDVEFLAGAALHPAWQIEEAILVSLAFSEDARQLLLVLPGEDLAPEALGALAGQTLTRKDAEPVRVALPRIGLARALELTSVLDALGIADGLAEGLATLTEPPLETVNVLQSVRLGVDETGAEATAATAVIGTRSLTAEPAREIVFDRPFALFLIDPAIPTPLIAGIVRDPR